MDSWIYCWDLRDLQAPISKLERPLKTHQRIYFDINSRSNELITGDESGYLRVYDINQVGEKDQILPSYLHKLHNGYLDSIPISRCHPYLPLIFTCSGSRDLTQDKASEFSLNIWKLE
ncbi:hypothetical protein CONCODRAFT_16681 [Conidiobolus coronatus NRRL 28638]|uniref:WD40 repeat-like protein n=1 Tax=Conidiobolus coronatus (strain ATCC 28846 / CBS 209.66 / NRRL 28638) TaxID=796925 RepID=A0A137P9Q7_CONC2|nr:hypothetical protein CONCODRAFT_16681 [Conidiobolus coronatus NRRL 28638]|eukprot:KXN71730.1 hypothetical protein CONCODRAFT_16681 [Conidiobolus coronatus NRRL 28638]